MSHTRSVSRTIIAYGVVAAGVAAADPHRSALAAPAVAEGQDTLEASPDAPGLSAPQLEPKLLVELVAHTAATAGMAAVLALPDQPEKALRAQAQELGGRLANTQSAIRISHGSPLATAEGGCHNVDMAGKHGSGGFLARAHR